MFGDEPFGIFEYGHVADAGVATPFQRALSAETGHIFLVEITAKQIGATTPVVLRYSDRGWTSPNVNGAVTDNVHFDGRVQCALQVSRTIPVAPELSRRLALNIGTITLINSDREFDDILQNYAVDGRDITVKMGLEGYAYADFQTIFKGVQQYWTTDKSTLQITVQGGGLNLDRPLQNDLYAGTGGINGNSQLTGTPKPIWLQRGNNLSPVFIDTSNLVFQCHDGAIQSITAVRDKGSTLTFVADYATYSALTAATLSTGQYATCLALGVIRLGGQPAGQVTFDGIGGVYSSHPNAVANIVYSLLLTFAGIDPTAINMGALASLDGFTGDAYFFQTNSQINVSDALDQFFASIFYWWGFDVDGMFVCGQLSEPDTLHPAFVVDELDILEAEVMQPFDNTDPPRWRQPVAFNINGTVQSAQDLAGGLSASDVQKYGMAYNVRTSSSTAVQADFASAFDPPVLMSPYFGPTNIVPFGDPAAALSTLLLGLFGQKTVPVRVAVGKLALGQRLGGTALITHPRVNDGEQWAGRIVDIDIDQSVNKYDVYVWGPL